MRVKELKIIAAILFLFSLIAYPSERATVIIGGKVITVTKGIIEKGKIVIRDGKIVAVGKNVKIPKGAMRIDARGKVILPGLIEADTTLGLGGMRGGDANEATKPNTAELSVLDAINPFDKNIERALAGGITTALINPGRINVIGGQGAVVKLSGRTVSEMVLLAPAGVKFSLGEGPKFYYGKKGRLPSTRMGAAYIVRKALLDARDYLKEWEDYQEAKKEGKDAKEPRKNLSLEPLAKLLKGELTAYIECYRADDIMTALRLIDEFKIKKAVLVGVSDGYLVADEIAKRKVPVIITPAGVEPHRMETERINIKNAAILHKAGVKVILHASYSMGVGAVRELPLLSAFAIKGGLPREEALKGITIYPAEVLGVSDRIGSIEPEKDADLVIFSGDPFFYRSRVEKVLINGKIVYSLK
ncbi:MAG: amidohydrolase family protein [Acidobacteria bacterium]|nr:amidohydrolase family protein [Acidobacteriota bacterium]